MFAVPMVLMIAALIFVAGMPINGYTVAACLLAIACAWFIYLLEARDRVIRAVKKRRAVERTERQK